MIGHGTANGRAKACWCLAAGAALAGLGWAPPARAQGAADGPEASSKQPEPEPLPEPPPPPPSTPYPSQPGAQPAPPGAYPPPQGAYPPPGAYQQPGYGYTAHGYAAPQPPPRPARKGSPKNRDAREDDKVALSAGGFLYNVLGIGVGAQLGVYATPDTLVEGDLLTAVALFPNVPQSNSFGLGVRQFVTSTFYLRGGLRYRMLRTEQSLLDFDPEYDEYVERKDLGFDFALGNRWQIGSFVIGADWFGIYAPLAHLDAEAVVEHQKTGAEQRQDVDDDEIDNQYDVRLVFLQVGASF